MPDKRTGFIFGKEYLSHLTGIGHPESPQRLQSLLMHLQSTDLWDSLCHIAPPLADVETVCLSHSDAYVKRVESACNGGLNYLDCGDTAVCQDSYSVALRAVGGVVEGVQKIFEGRIRNAFCAVRPPGHHAEYDAGMGFCLFNHAAIAAKFAQRNYDVQRVLILDWDVHHGNGTQHILERDPTIYYISLHQYPFYPGTGSEDERGKGDGVGATTNFPLPSGSDDNVYLDIFENRVRDIVMEFSPEFIILSSGFDAHRRDPLGGMLVSTKGFEKMSEIAVDLSRELCEGRLLSILEGGYNLQALAESVEVHVNALLRA